MDILKTITVTKKLQIIPCDTSGIYGTDTDVYAEWEGIDFLPDPKVAEIHKGAIKIESDPRCFNYHDLTLHIFSAENTVTQVIAETKGFWSRLAPVTKKILKYTLITVCTTILGGMLIYADKKHNNSKVGNWYKSISVFGVGEVVESTVKVVTNNYRVYESEDFLDLANDIKEMQDKTYEIGEYKYKYKNLKDYYTHTGNGLFAFKKLVRDVTSMIVKVDFDDASNFCNTLGGAVPNEKELNQILYGSVANVTDYVTPIESERNKPEWTRDELDGDYYLLYMKGSADIPAGAKIINGKLGGEEDDSKIAFRCVMYESTFIDAD